MVPVGLTTVTEAEVGESQTSWNTTPLGRTTISTGRPSASIRVWTSSPQAQRVTISS